MHFKIYLPLLNLHRISLLARGGRMSLGSEKDGQSILPPNSIKGEFTIRYLVRESLCFCDLAEKSSYYNEYLYNYPPTHPIRPVFQGYVAFATTFFRKLEITLFSKYIYGRSTEWPPHAILFSTKMSNLWFKIRVIFFNLTDIIYLRFWAKNHTFLRYFLHHSTSFLNHFNTIRFFWCWSKKSQILDFFRKKSKWKSRRSQTLFLQKKLQQF